jgi:SAM-dependent methyltransferase
MIRYPFSRTINEWITTRKFRAAISASGWHFSKFREDMILREIKDWHQHYLPINVKDLVILDIGAGEGETAKFFLDYGAAEVICIEPCHEAFKHLKENSATNSLVPLNKFFEISDLSAQTFDFLKMDIEGYEESLLETELSSPAVIEVHGMQLRDKFQKAGWRIEYPSFQDAKGYSCTCYAYWKC